MGEFFESQLLEFQSGLPVANPTSSYWHKEPSKALLGHRTTPDLPRAADVVIVGSGITGAVAAHSLKLQKPELNVVMLEAREACSGATGRNGGHCQPLVYASSAPHIASFELRNYAYVKSLVEDFSIPCDWHSTAGVHAYYSKEIFEMAKSVVEKLSEKYPDLAANVAVVNKGESGGPAWLLEGERREMTLDGLRVPNAEGAIVQWNAASLWPYKLVTFILEHLLAAESGGFNLQTNTPVTGLQRVEPPANLASSSDAGLTASSSTHPSWVVHTPRGFIAAHSVLLATNAYTSHLLPQFTDLIVPVRGQIAALKPPEEPATPEQPPLDIGHTFIFLDEPHGAGAGTIGRDDYLIQRPPPAAELILGGGRQHARGLALGVWDDSTLDEPVSWWLRGELPAALDLSLRDAPTSPSTTTTTAQQQHPHAAAGGKKQDLEATHEWTGIMGFSRDGNPWVGAVPAELGGGPGLYVAAGYTGHGMPNASLCGKAVVDIMFGADEVDLPAEYEITEERLAAARELDTVAAAEQKGGVFFRFMEV
ncbi:FAD dependent oxidoreductase [Xylariales sp. PMI_506]|nr:FAD dependent oxidoreductase [Xylariales sp. PMI_506]